jgi:hypothetical protein
MAHFSVTYERKPGCWRAAVTAKNARSGIEVGGDKVLSTITPYDSESESAARFAAEQLIRKL